MDEAIPNPFATAEGAARYRSGRPFHHPRALDRIFEAIGAVRVRTALDVACGTGLSTVALARRSRLVVGVDSVEAMVRLVERKSNTHYAVAAAEVLPFDGDTFEILTVSSGIHWFDQEAFFAEAVRVLVPGGWLAIYDHFFRGSADDPAFNEWLKRRYSERYPPPPRAPTADAPLVTPARLSQVATFEYEDPITFTHDQLVAYLLSHSNTIAPAINGRERPGETDTWIRNETRSWFSQDARHVFRFRGTGRCLTLDGRAHGQ